MPPTGDEIRAALERALASPTFVNAGRLSQFLRFVVERSLAGEGDQLKEYVLGVNVFQRPPDYDPRLDSIVRVEARRLRGRLAEYYRGPGAGETVIIDIPRGTYAPVFAAATPGGPPVAEDIPAAPDQAPVIAPAGATETTLLAGTRARWRGILLASAAVLGLAAAIGWRTQLPPSAAAEPTGDVAGAPAQDAIIRLAVLPFAVYTTDQDVAMQAARITDGVTTALALNGALSVVSRTSAAQFVSEDHPVSEVAQMLNCDLVMEGSVIAEDGLLKVTARLVDGVRDRKVWVGEYTGRATSIDEMEERIAAEAAPAALKIAAARTTP